MAFDLAANIKTVFRQYDANGDGSISSAELRTVLKSIGGGDSRFTDVEIDTAFSRIDVNKDGMIQYDEFVDWLVDDSVGFADVCMDAGANRNAEIQSAIIADIEKDDVPVGSAGMEAASRELEAVLASSEALERAQRYAPSSEEAVPQAVAAKEAADEEVGILDIPTSINIEFTGDESDFLDALALFRRLDSKQLRTAFQEADIDKSHFLSLSELQRFLFPGSAGSDKSLCVSKIFAQMDKNHDGKVGCAEFASYVVSTKKLLSSIPSDSDKKHIATAFSITDRDRSADISAVEFEVLLGASSEDEKATIQRAFSSLDHNRDGVLNVIEFSRIYGKELKQEASGPEVTWTDVPPDEDDE